MAHYSYIMSLLQYKITVKRINGLNGHVVNRLETHYNFCREMNKTAMVIYKTHCL